MNAEEAQALAEYLRQGQQFEGYDIPFDEIVCRLGRDPLDLLIAMEDDQE